jgi:hypothetical protein
MKLNAAAVAAKEPPTDESVQGLKSVDPAPESSRHHVIPAQAGIQCVNLQPEGLQIKECGALHFWIPVFAEMTIYSASPFAYP